MTNQHPITPPPELRCQWQSESPFKVISVEREDYMIDRAAQWGADQELEACCQWLQVRINEGWNACHLEDLRAARRPKPPSLKEQALDAHNRMMAGTETQDDWTIVRRALEALPDD